MMERTFVMMKPGVVQRRIVGEVLSRFEKKGLKLIALKLMRISPELAKNHYAEHADKPFFGELVQYITSAPVVAMAFEGDDAVALVRKLCGATKVLNAEPGTIRGDYALHTNINVVTNQRPRMNKDEKKCLKKLPIRLAALSAR